MDIFRIENNVPDVYVNNSRDFQLLARLKTVLFAAIKHDINSTRFLSNTTYCRDSQLENLSTKLGFFHNTTLNSDVLRTVLQAFPYLVRRKGTKQAIEQTINCFLKAIGLYTKCRVTITNKAGYEIIANKGTIADIEELQKHTLYVKRSGYYTPTTIQEFFPNYKSGVLYGDVNGDGVINNDDLDALNDYLQQQPGITINEDAADVNCDGKINSSDVVVLSRHLANWDDYKTLPHITLTENIYINNTDSADSDYNIEIGIESSPRDITVIKLLMDYIKPTGYTLSYVFYKTLPTETSFIAADDNIEIVKNVKIEDISRIRPKEESDNTTTGYVDMSLVVSKKDTNDTESGGTTNNENTTTE